MKNIYITLTFLTVLFLSSFNSFAWGKKGHALVAEIAFKNMDEQTKKNVLLYLDGMSIEDAANWMDTMRSNASFNYMKPYHYTDFEKGETVKELSGDNIIRVLNSTLKDLNTINKLSNEEIKTRLFYLFHLIGDIHQPLHVGYSSDKGGNTVQASFFGTGTNIHSLWDSGIIEHNGLALEDCLKLNKYSKSELAQVQNINVVNWAAESRTYLDSAYNIKGHKVGQEYVDANYPIIENQILKAGLRLASVLEHYFMDVHFKPSASVVVKEQPIGIDVNKVADNEGKFVKVCSRVFGAKYLSSTKSKPTFLNVGADFPNSPLTIVIWGDDRANFKKAPESFYNGKNVCIVGRVVMYKGKAEIIVNKESDIEIK